MEQLSIAEFGMFKVLVREGRLLYRGAARPVTPKAFQILAVLLENQGHVVTDEELMWKVWQERQANSEKLSTTISALRQAIGDFRGEANGKYKFVQRVSGVGYRFAAPVRWATEARAVEPRNGAPLNDDAPAPADSGAEGQSTPANANQENPAAPPGQTGTEITKGRVDVAASPGQAVPRHRWLALLGFGLAAFAIALASYTLLRPAELQVLGFTQLTHDGRKKSPVPIFTGGERVYFREDRRGGWALASVPVDGGDVTGVSLPPGLIVTDVSRNGSLFLGDERGADGVRDLVATSGAGKPVNWLMQPPEPDKLRRWSPEGAWSPRGDQIALWMENDIFVANADGSGVRKIAHLNGWPDSVRWSPDGRKLVFSVLNPKAEKFALWEVNADGTRLHALRFPETRFTETCCGAWMPDGKYLIFEADRHEIWAIRERKRFWSGKPKPVRLTSGPLNYHWPVPGRDGKEIFVLGEEVRGELMRFDLKTHTFAEFLGGISAAEVNFSRDGKWVAYVSYPEYTLWRARADGSDAMQLTFPPLEAREPRWSPDGKQIAFQGISAGAHYKIYLVSSAGGPVREAIPGNGEESVGTWSPDGRWLIYDEPLYRDPIPQMFVRRLDLTTGKTFTIPGSAGSWTARLSPDGRYVATLDATPAANPHRLIVFETATGRRRLTLTMPEQFHEPTWSRDGKYVYFATLDPPAPALYRLRVSDKKLEKLASLKGFPVAGLWTGVAPDGSPLLLRDISTQEIYALRVRVGFDGLW